MVVFRAIEYDIAYYLRLLLTVVVLYSPIMQMARLPQIGGYLPFFGSWLLSLIT
jgi:hypothetical protein